MLFSKKGLLMMHKSTNKKTKMKALKKFHIT